MGLLALLSVPAFIGCTQDEEYGEEFSGQEFATLAGKTVTRAAEGDGGAPIEADNRIALAGCDTIYFGETVRVAVELRWTEGYIYVTNGVTGPMSTLSIGNVWYDTNQQGSVASEGYSTVYWDQYSSCIRGIIYIRGTYNTSGADPHPVDFHYGRFVDHPAKNLFFKSQEQD